jgi:pimeloyl-ACP methyl ester carboxylesterase
MNTFEDIHVPVIGGNLYAAVRAGRAGSPNVVLVHGITANHLTWAMVADELGDEVTLIAPDLRGRARSSKLPEPFGMAQHAKDVVALLDHAGIDRATVVGHSMGAYVAAAFAANHDDRLAGLVLVDGGVSLSGVPEGVDVDAVLTAILGPTMQRLSMTFADVDAWLDFWKAHPSLQEWNQPIEDYVMADLVGEPPNLRSSCNVEAIRADGADTLGDGGQFFRQLRRPTPWLRAPRGLLNEAPLYSDEVAAQMCAEVPFLQDMLVDDVNHFTITLSDRGAKAVADVIRTQLR